MADCVLALMLFTIQFNFIQFNSIYFNLKVNLGC